MDGLNQSELEYAPAEPRSTKIYFAAIIDGVKVEIDGEGDLALRIVNTVYQAYLGGSHVRQSQGTVE